ncbi:two-component system response regulator [Sulfitobacter sp. S190]|uniref:response regulator n=1 Tax=Sulfitobacter sp. S190 TaxID=2867022 RepID=UPI0021A38A13|nr:response regulator [Sulfitobacter sp. S190]UWR21932.1 response regulator [Sulfitobacter sp. S190]
MKILAVDDDPIILELLVQFMATVGQHDLVTAESGPAALALLETAEEGSFDCFMLDIQMPGMDGMELARTIRALPDYSESPIVMLTAMSEKRYIDGAFHAGATDYVTKPFDITELKTRIGVVEQLAKSNRARTDKIFSAKSLQGKGSVMETDAVALHDPMSLHDVDNVIECTAMENYVAQLSRSSLFGSTVFAFTLRKIDQMHEALSGAEFKFLIEDVAEVISDTLTGHQFLMSYAGNGTYVCITESGWRPDMSRLTDQVNLYLSRAQIMSNDGQELHPRVSSGSAIRLVWKSGDQIMNALGQAQGTAEEAAIEYERLKTDFFQFGRTA